MFNTGARPELALELAQKQTPDSRTKFIPSSCLQKTLHIGVLPCRVGNKCLVDASVKLFVLHCHGCFDAIVVPWPSSLQNPSAQGKTERATCPLIKCKAVIEGIHSVAFESELCFAAQMLRSSDRSVEPVHHHRALRYNFRGVGQLTAVLTTWNVVD